MISIAENRDCMDAIREFPDKYFDLAVCDPMYIMDTNHLCPGSSISTTGVKRKKNKQAKDLSKLPPTGMEYYNELIRVSRNQIIWGVNYYEFAGKIKGRVIWDKMNDTSSFSNAEIAACSFIQGVRIFRYLWNGMIQQDMKNKEVRIHAFQKPIALYSWLYKNYLPEGGKVLDSHLGSGSNRIAAHKAGNIDFYGYELDADYHRDQEKRFAQYASQLTLFQCQRCHNDLDRPHRMASARNTRNRKKKQTELFQ